MLCSDDLGELQFLSVRMQAGPCATSTFMRELEEM